MTTALGLRLAVVVLLFLTAAGCAGRAPDPCPPPDVGTVPGWAGHLRAHPDDVAYLFDDGRGRRVEHRADAVQAMASAGKVLLIVAYAREVALGHVRADEPVAVGAWERWLVAGNEEAHARALDGLGITRTGTRAADPGRTVTLDQIANQVSIWSDDAGPDLLRARLGDAAVRDAGRAVGWTDPELPSTTGFLVSLYTPELVPPATDRPARRTAEWELARRYATDPAFRADVDTRPAPGVPESVWADGGPGGTARQLAALWTAIGHATFPGADRARAITEQGPSTVPGLIARGVKGGLLSGIVTRGTEIRRDDGTVAVGVLLVRGLDAADTQRLVADSRAFDDAVAGLADDPAVLTAGPCPP
ncbi:serine hydrolase [Actinomycetospora termitidis]|uniref:Serine hydrolase n=1 Tax=Actinomycetospora termitidis TaxID=3053470 RepID=A0ABT7MF98_9PSEU|nr:serine hydrolase [Actinomycetospora sp. Odt1-22]MDL5159339.1 serine hydrolase [Actinomycetospora sp. Odt1-22]